MLQVCPIALDRTITFSIILIEKQISLSLAEIYYKITFQKIVGQKPLMLLLKKTCVIENSHGEFLPSR
jgi:hypothetical protein